jgi:hypothetical protein
MVKMNVIDYIMITCNLKKNDRLQITSDYMKKCNRLQLITITITPCLWGKPSILLMINNWLSHWSVFQLYSPRERIKQYFKTQMTEGRVVQQGKWLDHTIERPPPPIHHLGCADQLYHPVPRWSILLNTNQDAK